MKNKNTLINVISNLFLQFVTIVSGFIIPKLILNTFGSEVNGLVSSLNQFLNYISVFEGGVLGVILTALYKPLVNNDTKKISSILKTSDSFYCKIGYIYIVYTLIIGICYPLFIKTSFSFNYIFILTIIISFNTSIQYFFNMSKRALLAADNRLYILSLIQSIITLLNIILSYISIKIYPSIHVLKLVIVILNISQPILLSKYIKSNYNIDKDVKKDNKLLKSRWDGFALNLADLIHLSTDTIILTIFTNLKLVSIYSVYSLVTIGLRAIVNAISSAINPSLGISYANADIEDVNKRLDVYEYIILIIVFLLFVVASLLITPFVELYTRGITDTNYNHPIFGILLVISEALYLLKYPHINLAYVANKYKEITKSAILETLINIVLSIILVFKYKLIGIVIATIISMLFRLIYQVIFSNKIINNRKCSKYFKKILLFIITSLIGLFIIYLFLPLNKISISNWIIYGIIYTSLFVVLYTILSLIFFKKEIKFIEDYLKK